MNWALLVPLPFTQLPLSTRKRNVGVPLQPSAEPVKVSTPLLQAEFPLTAIWAVILLVVTDPDSALREHPSLSVQTILYLPGWTSALLTVKHWGDYTLLRVSAVVPSGCSSVKV